MKYPLYQDIHQIVNESELKFNERITKLPEVEDYHYSYFEKLWEFLKIEMDPKVKSYAMNEIWNWKGTLKIFPLLQKWFGIEVVLESPRDTYRSLYSLDTYEIFLTVNVTIRTEQPDLLKKLITDYVSFLLFFYRFKLVYKDLHHIIEVNYRTKVNYNLLSFQDYDIELV